MRVTGFVNSQLHANFQMTIAPARQKGVPKSRGRRTGLVRDEGLRSMGKKPARWAEPRSPGPAH